MSDMFKQVRFAVISGVCASTGSVFGKLSGLPTFQDYYLLRIIFFVLMLVFNTICLTYFVKALQENLSLTVTLISSSTNYIVTALAGFLIFQESTSLLWWSGIFLIIIGLVLIVSDGSQNNHLSNKKTQTNAVQLDKKTQTQRLKVNKNK